MEKYMHNNGVTVMVTNQRDEMDYRQKGFYEVDVEGNRMGIEQSETEMQAIAKVEKLEAENQELLEKIAELEKPKK
jgi:hypothetical protein